MVPHEYSFFHPLCDYVLPFFKSDMFLTCNMVIISIAKVLEGLLGVPTFNIAATVTFS